MESKNEGSAGADAKKKSYSDYKLKVNKLMKREDEFLTVSLDINEKLRKLLDGLAVKTGKEDYVVRLGEARVSSRSENSAVRKRYKMKSGCFDRSFDSNYFYLFFDVELIDTGHVELRAASQSDFSNLTYSLNTSFKNWIGSLVALLKPESVEFNLDVEKKGDA
jgi:hypothetical protein